MLEALLESTGRSRSYIADRSRHALWRNLDYLTQYRGLSINAKSLNVGTSLLRAGRLSVVTSAALTVDALQNANRKGE